MTKRFAGVDFVACGSDVSYVTAAAVFGVCTVKPLRRPEGAFGLGFWVDGAAAARKRCGDGVCVGIVMFSFGNVCGSIGC
jgi:hypothetical protein